MQGWAFNKLLLPQIETKLLRCTALFSYNACILSVSYQSLYCHLSFPAGTQNAAKQRFDSGGASSMVILVISDVILAACCFPSFSSSSSFPSPSLGFGRLDVAKAHYCPHRSQIEVWIALVRFLIWREILSSLISRDHMARDLVTPLVKCLLADTISRRKYCE